VVNTQPFGSTQQQKCALSYLRISVMAVRGLLDCIVRSWEGEGLARYSDRLEVLVLLAYIL
jgi:hypothetical protein